MSAPANEIDITDDYVFNQCYYCKKDNQESQLTIGGPKLFEQSKSFVDDNGVHHIHNFNWTCSNYRCTKGHHYEIRSVNGCSICDTKRKYYLKEN